MALSAEYREFITELLAGFGRVTIRAMFGGAGIFHNGVMFALVVDDTLYFKVDETTRFDFESEMMKPFTYQSKQKTVEMSFWQAPALLYDSSEDMTVWAHKAYAAAVRSKQKKA